MKNTVRERADLSGSFLRPGPGEIRPGGRTERVRIAVARAALELLHEGKTDLNAAEVANRAGVNRSTIFRRWPTRSALLREAMTLHTSNLTAPDTGSYESDIHELVHELARFFQDPVEIAMNVAMAAHCDPEFNLWQLEYWAERVTVLTAPFERAIERDEIESWLDPKLLVELLAGPMIVRTTVLKTPLDEAFLVDLEAMAVSLKKVAGK